MSNRPNPVLSFFICGTLMLIVLILNGCASSDVSRHATNNLELGVQNAKKLVARTENSNVADQYQNTSQTTKGALLGGAAGAVTGMTTSGLGVVPLAATGAILGASYGKFIDSKTTLKDQLINRGANIVVLGDQVLIVFPSARLFSYMSEKLKPESYSTLRLLAGYINQYTKILVNIRVYTSDSGSDQVDLALSKQQANNLAKALLKSGLDARLLHAMGYGGTHLVASNSLEWDESENYRVEITLEKLYG